jgi:photosystem II stability/assembly factor-like uncharacterized protein
MTSTNGGQTWSEDTALPKLATVEPFDFLTANDGYVLAPVRTISGRSAVTPVGTRLHQTTDGGVSWRRVDQSQSQSMTLTNLVFLTSFKGLAVEGSRVFETEDGGRRLHWIAQEPDLDFHSLWSLNQILRLSQ